MKKYFSKKESSIKPKIFNLRKFLSSPLRIFVLIIFIFGCSFFSENLRENSFEARVLRVIDGDTIEIKSVRGVERVRLFGIDAPESKQEFGTESTKALNSILNKKQVKIYEKSKDKYGRTLALVELNGEDVNKFMVRNGFAWAYKYYTDKYLAEQIAAKRENLGLWNDENPMEPFEFRKKFMNKAK